MVLLATLFSCISTREFPVKYKGDQIHFGQGGGFSGALNYFALLEDGRLFKRSFSDSTFTLVDTWNDDFVTQMFSNYNTLQLDQVKYNEPGDLYYFISFRKNGLPAHNITWGRLDFSPQAYIVTYYNLLYKSTKSKS